MKYKIIIERKQRGKNIGVEIKIITSNYKPRIGESKVLLIDPPIYETIIEVEEIKEDEKT